MTMLKAGTEIVVADAPELLRRLCEHFAEHGEASFAHGRGRIALAYGSARLRATEQRLAVETEAADEIGLAYMKMGLAEHVMAFAAAPAPVIRWTGDGAGGTVLPFFREMRVVSSMRLTPHMQRVRLAGRDLARFAEGGLHVRLLFPPAGRPPVWPWLGEDGRIVWPDGENGLQHRVYTIRRIDPAAGTVDIDIVLHEGAETPGSRFAVQAVPGDVVGMTGPGGGHLPAASSLLLLGDDTALPAICRILEALPAGARAKAVIEVDGPADEMAVDSPAEVEMSYLHRLGRPAGQCALLSRELATIDFEPFGEDLFVWAACEFSDFAAIRRNLRGDRGMARDRHLVVSYWRLDAGDDRDDADAR